MLQTYSYKEGNLVEDTASPCLYAYTDPTPEEIEHLVQVERLNRHNLESALDPDELGRVEPSVDDGHIFIILKRPKNYSSGDHFFFRITSIGICLYADKIVLIMPERIDFIDDFVFAKHHDLPELLLRIILSSANHFLAHLKVMAMVINSVEEKTIDHLKSARIDSERIMNVYSLQKSLIYYSNGISSNQIVLEKVRQLAPRFLFSAEHIDLLDDIVIENNQCGKLSGMLSEIALALTRTRDTIVNNKLNMVMKRLTIITTMLMPGTVITGLFGMSEYSAMVGGNHHWYITYPLFASGLGLIALFTYRYLKKRGWT